MALRWASGLWRTLTGGRRGGAAACGIRAGRGAGINFGAILQFVQAVNNHAVSGIQAGAQADTVASGLCDGYNSNLRGVVGIGGINVSSLGTALNGRGGNDGEVVLGVDEKVDIDKLIGEESVVRVRKHGFELVCAGGYVDLIIDGLELPASDFGGVIAVVGIDSKLDASMELGVYLRKLILRKTENYRDRLELGDGKKSGRI